MSVINRLEELLIAGLLAFMALTTCLQVVLRYVFNSGILWGMEATSYAFLWMVLLGVSYGIRTNSHIAVDLFVRKLSPAPRRTLTLFAGLLCIVYAVLMLQGSYVYVDRLLFLGVDAQDIPVPKWLLSAALPIGFAFLILRLLDALKDIYQGRRETLGGEHEGQSDDKAEITNKETGAE
ncbi:TRAP transporter small permease [Emcibacter sp.]|uniref:TRAP transporter small permease n=1 Tax=Emcibacter sp. TaxID=1979954 RepID=UPI003A955B8D